MDDIPLPERSEIERWMISTVRHSSSVEYFLSRLGVRGEFDLQRPHDISGPHSRKALRT
jgi:hypothetical protein